MQKSMEAVQCWDGVQCYSGFGCTGMQILIFIILITDEEIWLWTNLNIHYLLFVLFIFWDLQEAARRSNNWLPPPWAIAAMLLLGFNELMMLLRLFLKSLRMVCLDIYIFTLPRLTNLFWCRNPLYLGIIFVGYLLVKAIWVQLDISSTFHYGAVSFKNGGSSKVTIAVIRKWNGFIFWNVDFLFVAASWCDRFNEQNRPDHNEPSEKTSRDRTSSSNG